MRRAGGFSQTDPDGGYPGVGGLFDRTLRLYIDPRDRRRLQDAEAEVGQERQRHPGQAGVVHNQGGQEQGEDDEDECEDLVIHKDSLKSISGVKND